MYYGQNKEDEFIRIIIDSMHDINFKGTILDLGANDGITLSNSRYFIENGWEGFLVEAGKKPFEKLMNTILPNTIAINCAIGNYDGVFKFYESTNLLNTGDVGLVSSLIADETKRWKNAGIEYTEYDVECYTWKSFLNRFQLQNQNFDIISIDIEGMDYDVLIQMNLEELGCKILCIEFNGKDIEKYVYYADKFNMTLAWKNAENLIFIK